MPNKTPSGQLSKHVATVRIIFGLMWGIDAVFKWRSAFRNGFLGQIQSAAVGQPGWLHGWFSFWIHLLSHNPHAFAMLVTLIETIIALSLIFGFARRSIYLAAAIFSLLIWAIPEGFGGPYSATSTDIGTGIIYAVVLFSLYGLDRLALNSKWSVDNYMTKHIRWWSIVANP